MNGDRRHTTIASYGEKKKHIAHDTVNPRAASIMIPIASDVSPLTAEISSVKMFDRIPGALCLSSNQPTCFLKNASNNLTLKVWVRLSLPNPKQSF